MYVSTDDRKFSVGLVSKRFHLLKVVMRHACAEKTTEQRNWSKASTPPTVRTCPSEKQRWHESLARGVQWPHLWMAGCKEDSFWVVLVLVFAKWGCFVFPSSETQLGCNVGKEYLPKSQKEITPRVRHDHSDQSFTIVNNKENWLRMGTVPDGH